PHRPRWHESLNLTLEQRREMRRIELAMFREARQCRQDANDARRELAALVAADEPDREAIAAQLDRISSMQRELKLLVIDSLLEQRNVLRPEQVETFNESLRELLFPPRGGPGHGGRGPAGRGSGRGGRGHGGGAGRLPLGGGSGRGP
ncbi:MAG: periplasmic heavy metal sensor, partial [Planctomycetota bacterium]|nr:periplasmic heavy metal sensor [Planctomycetota bacterium]